MVLENRLGITDSAELARTEEKISKQKALTLFEAGIPYNPSWVLDANWEPEKAYTMTAKLVNAGVDAIFVCQTGWQAVCITVFMIWDLKWERILLLLDLIMRRLQIGTFPR